jgi:hypothetical protein
VILRTQCFCQCGFRPPPQRTQHRPGLAGGARARQTVLVFRLQDRGQRLRVDQVHAAIVNGTTRELTGLRQPPAG